MRITHVVESLGRGGLERMVIDLAEEQINQGHACQIICLFSAGELAQEAESLGIKCIICNKKEGIDFSALFKLRHAINGQKSDVVHSHNAVAHYYTYFAILGFNNCCLINTRHGMGAKNSNSKRERHYRKTLKRTNYVVLVCEAARNKFLSSTKIEEDKCIVVKNGIKVDEFLGVYQRKKSKQDDPSKNDVITIGSIGRLNWAKDFKTMLDAFTLVIKKNSSSRLVIAGGGTLEEELKSYAEQLGVLSDVRFLGDMSDVKPVLNNIDIFVSSSISEGYSIALLEACAAGIPIVATDVGGSAEIVRHKKNGFIVPARDAVALADCILELIVNSNIRDTFGDNGREWVVEQGDVKTMFNNYNELYSKC